MTKLLSIEDFYKSDLNLTYLSAMFQHHDSALQYTRYVDIPRPDSGFLLLLSDITMTYSGQGFETVLKKGDIVYLPQGANYTMTQTKPTVPTRIRSCLVNFIFEDSEGKKAVFSDRPVLLDAEKNKSAASRMLDIATELSKTEKSPLRVKSLFYSLADSLIGAGITSSAYYHPIRAGIKYLESNWNRDVKISELAERCGVSETYFRRLFAKWSGMSPVEYRNTLRISNAKALLSRRAVSIAEVSYAVGFDDQFYFSRIFKKITGISPKDYRLSLQWSGEKHSLK